MLRFIPLLLLLITLVPIHAKAAASDAYRQGIALAAEGRDGQAVAMLRGVAASSSGIWSERASTAAKLIDMRQRQDASRLEIASLNGVLLAKYQLLHAPPQAANARLAGIFATLFPGAGHAWLGRWHDAGIAALMVWPMLLLTFWAAKRKMGPVTVFFALLTLWLWSGSVFSAVSLAERGAFEAYVVWWQGLWQASGLPGRPW
ncbi:MAG: hypothetical protein Q9M25_03860 [Mariprofundaceae bacterium]|nr:hypothetical protein [Mariprofundaceae bacterium]